MVPKPKEPTAEDIEERETFLRELQEYHEKRGYTLMLSKRNQTFAYLFLEQYLTQLQRSALKTSIYYSYINESSKRADTTRSLIQEGINLHGGRLL
jgi:hypothetical protein